MTVRNLDALLSPMTVTRVNPAQVIPLAQLDRNTRGQASLRLASLPALAVVDTACQSWADAIAHAAATGVRGVLLEGGSSPRDDASKEPRRYIDEALDIARSSGTRILGPGNAGIAVPRAFMQVGALRKASGSPPLPGTLSHGNIAWVSQCGDLARSMLHFAHAHAIGLSVAVALGDEADVDCADVLDYLADDPYTAAVVIAVERIKDARKFMSAARACAMNKPVIAWCCPPQGGNASVYDAAADRAGLVRVCDAQALFDAVATLHSSEVSSSALLAAYRAGRERLAKTPITASVPTEISTTLARARSIIGIDSSGGRAALSCSDTERLLGCFNIRCETSAAADESGTSASSAEAKQRLRIEMREDATFGPYLAVSVGAKTACMLLPFDNALAIDAVSPLIDAAGSGANDAVQLANALASLSCMLCGITHIVTFRSYARASAEGIVLEQVLIETGAADARSVPAIRPYPAELEETLEWRGRQLTIRPIRPDDEAAHARLFQALTPNDVRMRFFHFAHAPDHSKLVRYVRIDYEREMAFVACTKDDDGDVVIHGVARARTDPDNDAAEFAVTIRSDEKGYRLGQMLTERIVQYCRSRGTRELRGEVLHENSRMLHLALNCGFVVETTDDPEVQRISLPLAPMKSPMHC